MTPLVIRVLRSRVLLLVVRATVLPPFMSSDVTRFRVPGHVGFCNALRRTLLSDIRTEAPASVCMKNNVTCHTDEYIAHRVGLLPFRRVGNGDTLTLHVTGPCAVTCAHFTGPSFEPIHPDIDLLYLDVGHELSMEVTFDERDAATHARYSPCYAVGMARDADKDEDAYVISFGSNDHRTPAQLLREAFDHLDARLDRALRLLADDVACESYI